MPARRRAKYGNVKTTVDGITFDSKLEAKRWQELLLLQRAGDIEQLDRQTRFVLSPNNVHVCTIVVDFSYIRNGVRILEDTKSPVTAREKSYRIKKKLLKAMTGLDIVEVFK